MLRTAITADAKQTITNRTMESLLEYSFFQNAIIATLLISICCGVVGTYIVARRMVFIGGGITHASFGGLGVAYYLGVTPLLGATVGALISSIALTWLSKDKKIREDSLIGIFWSVGMAIGILFMNMTPGYVPNLVSFLFGNILTVTPELLTFAAILTAIIVLFFALLYRPLFYFAFDKEYCKTNNRNIVLLEYGSMIIIALTIVLCMKLAGIILVISYLTIPQAIGSLMTKDFKKLLILSTLISIFGSIIGLWASALLNTPSGATIVICFLIILTLCWSYKKIRNR